MLILALGGMSLVSYQNTTVQGARDRCDQQALTAFYDRGLSEGQFQFQSLSMTSMALLPTRYQVRTTVQITTGDLDRPPEFHPIKRYASSYTCVADLHHIMWVPIGWAVQITHLGRLELLLDNGT